MAPRTRRHNIVFVHTDSMDGRLMGCMGHPAMKRATPNLDALAARGVLFRNAYCNNPICCPSRSSTWSGQYTHHCEGWNNHKGLAETDPTFRTRLDEGGYRTQVFGKTDYLSGHHTIRARVSPWTRAANIHRPSYRMPGPRVVEDDARGRVHTADWDDVDRTVQWLQEAAASGEKPFWLYLGIRAPHPAFTISRRYLDMVDESGVSVPPRDESDHPVLQYQRTVKNWMHGFSSDVARTVRRIYFAMIAEVDAMVGRVLAAFDELGLTDSTYFIFSSDHGEMAMEHQQFYKMSPYEPSVHVPLIIAGPDARKGAEVETPVSLVDMYPTFMDMAGLAHPGGLDGLSLMPELAGRPSDRPDWALSEFHGTTVNTGCFMLRRGDWKYIHYVGYDPHLFNLKDDPHEVRDLAAALPHVAASMHDLLRHVVDYDEVDARVKSYDKGSFHDWREQQRAAGTYERTMARVYSGWDNLPDDAVTPWTGEDEDMIEQWLG